MHDTGRGSARLFSWNGVDWDETTFTASDGISGDAFGTSVSISGDGSMLAVGARNDDIGAMTNQGSAYLFRKSGSTWAEEKIIAVEGAWQEDRFGKCIALSRDGSMLGIGEPMDDIDIRSDQGSLWLFKTK